MRKSDIVKRIAAEAMVTPLVAEAVVDILLEEIGAAAGARGECGDSWLWHVRENETGGSSGKKPAHRETHRDIRVEFGLVQGVEGASASDRLTAGVWHGLEGDRRIRRWV